jgi:hypothetical protein
MAVIAPAKVMRIVRGKRVIGNFNRLLRELTRLKRTLGMEIVARLRRIDQSKWFENGQDIFPAVLFLSRLQEPKEAFRKDSRRCAQRNVYFLVARPQKSNFIPNRI